MGTFFLSHLLATNSEVVVYCLVRCDQETEGNDIIVHIYLYTMHACICKWNMRQTANEEEATLIHSYPINFFTGITKLQGCLDDYDLVTDNNMDRIKIICGDLEQNQFGLNHQAFVKLGESVSQIYHFGAHVNHVLGYSALRYYYSVWMYVYVCLKSLSNYRCIHTSLLY